MLSYSIKFEINIWCPWRIKEGFNQASLIVAVAKSKSTTANRFEVDSHQFITGSDSADWLPIWFRPVKI